ncbi:MAG: protocatechuate 3,4-dioxygenase subunit alpha [Vicinamibacterales bacterium]
MSRDQPLIATASQTVGPFFHFGLTQVPHGSLIDRLPDGDPVTLVIRVTDGAGEVVTDAMIELVQAGVCGRMPTAADGRCVFRIARLGTVAAEPRNGQAPHLHLWLFARGLLRHIQTRIYFSGDERIDRDPVLALVPPHRRQTLLASPDPDHPGTWTFDVRLQGAQETVFFDG